jgi:hypothetical protein
MEKLKLLSTIDKYYLNGIGEKVKWEIKNNNITIKTFSPTKDMVGIITAPFEFPDSDFVIFDTSKLIKLINICAQFITLDIKNEQNIATKLLIADNEYNLEYALANPMLAPSVNFSINDFESNYSFDITNDLINIWLKAYKALGSEVCTIKAGVNNLDESKVYFTLGEADGHSNKIMFETPTTSKLTDNSNIGLKFNTEYLKAIFDANYNSEGTAYINNEGAMKLEFKTEEGQHSSYIVLAKI